jgi:hypothetical protein
LASGQLLSDNRGDLCFLHLKKIGKGRGNALYKKSAGSFGGDCPAHKIIIFINMLSVFFSHSSDLKPVRRILLARIKFNSYTHISTLLFKFWVLKLQL